MPPFFFGPSFLVGESRLISAAMTSWPAPWSPECCKRWPISLPENHKNQLKNVGRYTIHWVLGMWLLMNQYQDPYEPIRISWNVSQGFCCRCQHLGFTFSQLMSNNWPKLGVLFWSRKITTGLCLVMSKWAILTVLNDEQRVANKQLIGGAGQPTPLEVSQEIRPYKGLFNHWITLVRPY